MKIIKGKDLKFVPASHEDPQNPGVLKKILLFKDDLIEGRIQMVNWSSVPVGKSFRNHYHEDMSEVFILVSSKARMVVDGEEVELEKGDCVVVPILGKHKMTNIGRSEVLYIVVGISQGKNGKTVVVED